MARMWEVRANIVHDPLNTLLNNGGTNENRYKNLLSNCFLKQGFQLFLGKLFFAIKVFHHQFIVSFSNQIAQFISRNLSSISIFIRNVFNLLAAINEVASFHTQNINYAFKVFVDTNRNSYSAQTRAKTSMELRHGNIKISSLTVDVINKYTTGSTHHFSFMPQTSGHILWTSHRIDYKHAHFANLHGCESVSQKVGLTRCV